MFKKKYKITYDKTGKRPVIRSSICTGERVAGFKDNQTGKFEEIMLLRDENDLEEFLERYDVDKTDIIKEW